MGNVHDNILQFVEKKDKEIQKVQKNISDLKRSAIGEAGGTKELGKLIDSMSIQTKFQSKDVARQLSAECSYETKKAKLFLDRVMFETYGEVKKLIDEKKSTNYDSVIYLINTMKRWLDVYPSLSIIGGTFYYKIKADDRVKSFLRTCEEEFLYDHVMKKEELKRRKIKYNEDIEKDKKKLSMIKDDLYSLKIEYSFKNDSYDTDLSTILICSSIKTADLNRLIEKKEKELEEKEDELRRCNNDFFNAGKFDASKKKTMEREAMVAEEDVVQTIEKLHELEKAKSDIDIDKDNKIKNLNVVIENLKSKIDSKTSEFAELEERIAQSEELVTRIK